MANVMQEESRTENRLREHYEIEKALADKLRNANQEQRKHLYTELYDELFIKVPDHPQLTQKVDEAVRSEAVLLQTRMLFSLSKKEDTFMEIGPGDCRLSFEMAKHVKKVIAVDVSDVITKSDSLPENFQLVISDGTNINVPPDTVNIAYSYQLMEHLHPEDAAIQLKNIYKLLAPGGIYICITPHRFSGPHDISMYFDEVATGFHLKEYTYSELNNLLKSAGFTKTQSVLGIKGVSLRLPVWPFLIFESLFNIPPKALRRRFSHLGLFQSFLGIKIMARKQ